MKKVIFLALSLFIATTLSAQLSGTYTINSNSSQNPDYTSMSAAVSALSAGVSGQVVFEVAPGTYEEYVELGSINGASETNRVIFRGMGSDNQQVTLTSNAGYTDNSTVKLDGTDYVTFENMTVTSSSTSKAVLVKMMNGNTGCHFQDVRFVGAVSNTNLDNDKTLVYRISGEWQDFDNEFVGCHFENGYIALYYQGHNIYTLNDGLLVEDCTFLNQAFKSIYVTFTDNAIVRGNTITNHTHDVLGNYHAMDFFRIRYNSIIENNVMNVTRNSNYSTVFETRPGMGTETEPIIIRNNIINLVSNVNSSWCCDFDDSNSSYIYFVNNTVKCSGTGECGSIMVEKEWSNLYLYNNLIVNETSGYVMRFMKNAADRFCDYNRFQFSGSTFGRLGSEDCATLSDWTTTTGFDTHSALCTPQFVGATDLHITSSDGLTVANPLSYVTTDIDGQNRSATAPCAGADEFTSGTNLPPVVQNPVSNITFETYPASETVNLNNTFNDPDDPNENIVITVASNSNPTLVSATLNNRTLTVERLASTGGSSTITLNAESAGQSVQTSFSVECVAEDLPPVVANQLAPINFTEYPQTLTFDLNNTFDDPDNNNDFIEIDVQTCPSEITANVDDDKILSVSRNISSAFNNKTLVIRATSNGKYVDMNVSVSGVEVVITIGTAEFEDVTLGSEGYWIGEEGENEIFSGGWIFTNYYSSYFWGGFTVSNHTDMTQTGMNAQYTAAAEGGYDGSAQYGVAYTMGAQTEISASDGESHTVTGCYVTNNLWTYQSIVEGDNTATPFGGTSGNDPDWFKLTATGKNANGQTVGTLDFYLADYRFENNDEDYVLNTWEWFDLSPLGSVASISFSLESTKTNDYGMLTPAYFCIDNFNGTAPSTEDLPPYIVNPVEDQIFTEFPQTIQIDLNGVATDPDDDDNLIYYTLLSNPNEAELSAEITNKTLVLTRLSREEATATLVLRAISDGQFVNFEVNVTIYPVEDGVDELSFQMSIYPNPTYGELNIKVDNADNLNYQIINTTGQVVMSGIINGNEGLVNLYDMDKGVYFISVATDNQTTVRKFVIQ